MVQLYLYLLSILSGDVPAPAALLPVDRTFLTYSRVPWKLRVRKEVFSPLETYNDPAILDLLYAQVNIFSLPH